MEGPKGPAGGKGLVGGSGHRPGAFGFNRDEAIESWLQGLGALDRQIGEFARGDLFVADRGRGLRQGPVERPGHRAAPFDRARRAIAAL